MSERRRKLAVLLDFNQVCIETVQAQPKPQRSHRRRLEKYRSKIHDLIADPEFKEVAENRMKVLNILLHYANTGDDVQFMRAHEPLDVEFTESMNRLHTKVLNEGRDYLGLRLESNPQING